VRVTGGAPGWPRQGVGDRAAEDGAGATTCARLRASIPAAGRGSVGQPVLSIWQTDIIYYGKDLVDYIRQEFGGPDMDRTDQHWNPNASSWVPLFGARGGLRLAKDRGPDDGVAHGAAPPRRLRAGRPRARPARSRRQSMSPCRSPGSPSPGQVRQGGVAAAASCSSSTTGRNHEPPPDQRHASQPRQHARNFSALVKLHAWLRRSLGWIAVAYANPSIW
jgi:hypothetical protein